MSGTTFKYRAVESDGSRCSGSIDAPNEHDAFQRLARRGIVPLSLKESSSAGMRLSPKRITRLEIATLTREMSVLVEANIPIARGLMSVAEHEKNQILRDMVTDIASLIESGEKITNAFSKYKGVFGDVYIETLRSAENTGQLGPVTSHLADMLERNIETNQQVRRAITYPLIVVCFVAMALGVIVVFVVPKFALIFEANGVTLPLTTRIIRSMGDSLTVYWWAYLGMAVAGGLFVRKSWMNPKDRLKLERLIHNVPYIGNMFTAVTTARFSRVLSIGLESGIEVIEAIEIAGGATGRMVFKSECDRMCDRMRSGDSLSDVMNRSSYLPSFARRLFGSGKDSKELLRAGSIIARHYDRQSDHLAKNLNTFIEPMITIAMAGIVLLVALSVFLPMWQMISISK